MYSINSDPVANYSLTCLTLKGYSNAAAVTIKGAKSGDLDLTQKKQGL